MKINKYIGLAVCSCFMAACQNDGLEINQPMDSEKYTLIGQIVNNDADSRAQIELGCQETYMEYFFWNEEDRFTMYQHIGNELVAGDFVISEDYSEANGGAQNAEFSSTVALTPSASYSAIYPSPTTVTDNKVNLEIQRSIDFTSATTDAQKAEVWKNYFKNNLFMAASGKLSESGRNYVEFKHLCSLIRITYANQTGSEQQISGVRLDGQNIGISMNYDLMANNEAGSSSTTGFRFSTQGLTVADQTSVDLYIPFFPKAIENANLEITIMQPSGNKTISVPKNDILFINGNNQSFLAGRRYWFDLTDTPDGLDWTKNMNTADMIIIPNKELSTALQGVLGSYKVKINSDGYAMMTSQHVNQVTALDFRWMGYTITESTGIENFVNLQYLYFNAANMTKCDLSKNIALKEVDLAFNKFTELDLSANVNLEYIYLSGCKKMTSLNISTCSALKYLYANSCGSLASLDVPNKSNLLALGYSSTNLSFNVAEFPSLIELNCAYTGLTELDITPLTNLEYLDCEQGSTLMLTLTDEQKVKWDASWSSNNSNVTLQNFTTDVVTIENPELSTALQAVLGGGNVTINSNGYAVMTKEYVESVQTLDFGYGRNISSLKGIEYFKNITYLRICQANLSECDLSQNTSLSMVNLNMNQLKDVDFSKNTALTEISISNNQLEELNLENNQNLTFINCGTNPTLSSLSVSSCTNLTTLWVGGTALTSLVLPNPEKIGDLQYYSTGLSFDLSKFTGLYNLNCADQNLDSFVLPAEIKAKLKSLILSGNNLTELDLNGYTILRELNCVGNKLETLDITPLTQLNNLSCGKQNENQSILKLKLSESQKTLWENTWKAQSTNVNVTLNTDSL